MYGMLTIYAPMIYTAPRVIFLMRADALRGEVGPKLQGRINHWFIGGFMNTRIALRAVLRIHDILAWIRIRIWICGSMPLTNGFGSGYGSG
jgi:hypothetical protein